MELVRSIFGGGGFEPPSWDDSGISCDFEGQRAHLPWHEVASVFACKKDCWTVDLMRVTVCGPRWSVDWTENTPSFYLFCDVLGTHLAVLPDWQQQLWDLPPFSRTKVTVFPANL